MMVPPRPLYAKERCAGRWWRCSGQNCPAALVVRPGLQQNIAEDTPVDISNPDRMVFPEIRRTKADVVAYYQRIAPRAFPHVAGRPLSIRRFPKGLAGPGFFQKNVPEHYPDSIERFAVPRSR